MRGSLTGTPGPWGPARRRSVMIVALLVAIVASGCGDDEDSESAGDGPLKVGALLPLTGPQAIVGKEQLAGMRFYLKEQPTFGGRKVELKVEDDASDPAQAVTKTRKLLTSDDVDVVTGVINSAVLNAIGEQITTRKVPLVVTNAGLNAFTQDAQPYGFRISHTNSQNNRALGAYAANELGLKRVAVLTADYVGGEEHTGAFEEVFEAEGGEVTDVQKAPQGTTDFAPYIAQVPDDVDALYVFVVGADAVRFWSQAKSLGLDKRLEIIGPGFVADDLILGAVKGAADGFVGTLQYVSTLPQPENQRFVKAFEAANQRPPSVYSADAYTGMQAIARALDSTDGELGEPFAKALAETEFTSPRGPVRLDDRHQAILDVYVYRVTNGKPKVLDTITGVDQDWQPSE